MLKRYFAVQPRPKRDEINRLSRELNFPPRVIQVWFQNARARDRREALYQVAHGSSSGAGNGDATTHYRSSSNANGSITDNYANRPVSCQPTDLR